MNTSFNNWKTNINFHQDLPVVISDLLKPTFIELRYDRSLRKINKIVLKLVYPVFSPTFHCFAV